MEFDLDPFLFRLDSFNNSIDYFSSFLVRQRNSQICQLLVSLWCFVSMTYSYCLPCYCICSSEFSVVCFGELRSAAAYGGSPKPKSPYPPSSTSVWGSQKDFKDPWQEIRERLLGIRATLRQNAAQLGHV